MQASQMHPLLMFLAAIVGALLIAGCQVGLRLLIGDPLRKATPKELRWYSAFFAFLPLWMGLFAGLGHSYLDRAGPVALLLYAMAAMLSLALWLWGWAKFVPAKVTWWFGGFVWSITLWLAFTNRLT